MIKFSVYRQLLMEARSPKFQEYVPEIKRLYQQTRSTVKVASI